MSRGRVLRRTAFLSWIVLGVVALTGLSAFAQDPNEEPAEEPVRITGVESGGTDLLNILGENFDKGDPNAPQVWINEDEIEGGDIVSWGPDLIVINFEYDDHTDTTGNILEVGVTIPETGEEEEAFEYDDFCLAVDEQNNPYECDFDAGTSLAPVERVVQWLIANDPPEETFVEYGYKFGPVKVEHKKHPFGDPVYYQLLDDYTINMTTYLQEWGRNPWGITLLDRCSNDLSELAARARDLQGAWNDDDPKVGGGYITVQDGILTIRKGYRWDGPSLQTPRISQEKRKNILAKPSALMRATIVHDAIYDLMRLKEIEHYWVRVWGTDAFWNRQLADCLFFMLATQDHYKKSKARSNFDIIRLGGAAKTKDDLLFWKFHAVADAGEYEAVNCAANEGVDVALDGSGSRHAVDWDWAVENQATGDVRQFKGEMPEVTLEPGIYKATLTVDDGDDGEHSELYKDTDTAVIELNPDTEPPVFLLANDQAVVSDPGQCSALVDFDVVATDDCGPPEMRCTNASNGEPVMVGAPNEFPVGTTQVVCVATDIGGNETVEDVWISVTDVEPPVIHGIDHPLTMWPPNHRYRTFSTRDFVFSLADNCTAPSMDDVLIRQVTSDEPEDGKADGNTRKDIVIAADGKSVRLRSERQGGGNGRVYTVYLEVADAAGNVTTEPFEVHAVDDRHGLAAKDADAYTVEYQPPTAAPPAEREPRGKTTRLGRKAGGSF